MSSTEGSDAALGGNVGRDECETYVRVAEPKEQGVGSMFDEGLLDFVSNYRRSEGEKLRLMDEQNLKFATSQVLRRQQMYERGTTGEPDAGGIIGNKSPWSSSSRRGQMPAQMPVKHGPGDQHGLSNEHGYGYEQGREDDQRETPTRPLRAARDAVDHGPPTTKMSDGVFGCCRSNSRDADQDPKASGAANLREEHSGNRRGGTGRQVDGRSTKMHQGNGRVDPRHALPDGGSTSQCRTKESRRGTSMTKDYRNLSYKICMEGSQEHNNSRLRPVGKARTYLKGDETSLPIPSYALPTKHFKNTNRYNVNGSGVDAPREEIIHRWKLPQRQAQIDEEKTALKLRLEGQRRAIHELEHQANTLREDVRSREEDIKRLKRKLAAMSTSMKRESCSCRASTHHTRLRTGFDSGVATVMSRVKVAEEPMRELESHLAESKTREDRSREKGAFPECSHSGTQEKTAKLECDLAALRLALSEAKRELRQREKDPQFHVRDPDKLREHEAGGRNVEIARADAAESGARLRKDSESDASKLDYTIVPLQMSKELDATRDEAKLLRLEMTQANARVGDLERENDMLQDRLRETSFLGKVRERDRDSWILSEPRGKSPSSVRLPTATGPGGRGSEKEDLQVEHSPRRPYIRVSSQSQPETSKFARVCGARFRRSSRQSHVEKNLPDSSSTSESPKPLRELSYVQGSAAHRVSARKEDSRTGDGPRTIGRRFEQTCHRSSSRTELTSGGFCDAKRTIATIRQASPECSTLSAGSSRTSMRERYEKLRAMYKKVNQRDTRIRGRAGVG